MKNGRDGFQKQVLACLVVLLLSAGVALATRQTGFVNVGWFVVGAVFLFRPAWPRRWDHVDHKRLKLACQVGGTILILLAMLVRFGV